MTAPAMPTAAPSLRVRLLVAIAAVLALALVAAGAILLESTRANLVAQVDATLRHGVGPGFGGPGGDPDDPGGRRIAIVVLDTEGGIVATAASGFSGRPDPLPDVSDVSAALAAGRAVVHGVIADRPAVEGDLRYRSVVVEGRLDTTVVLGASLGDVQAAVSGLVRDLVLIGLVALAAVVVLGWLILRRGLRPLEAMSAAADEITAGDLSARARQPHDGTEVGRLAVAFDRMLDRVEATVSEERAARAEQEVSEGRLRRFVSDASHELRTPLTTVRGYADLYAAGGLAGGSDLDAAMARIAAEAERMGVLVEDLLLLARLDQGRPLRREPVDLVAIVGEAVADARAIEPDRPMTFDAPPGAVAEGDPDRLRQVVANLLANVRTHTPAGSPVEVALARIDGSVELRVVDHGPGIAAAEADRVFDRFYRSDAGRSRDHGGSGLGLSIVASIAAAHGGSVAHEPTPGGGATFVVRVPAVSGGPS